MKQKCTLLLVFLTLFLAACGGGSQTVTANPVPGKVNGFGSAINHVHSLVILPDAQQTLVLATHYGIFRSQDHGASWQETAAGPHQLMQGLMTYSLSYNTLNPQRLYVLTLPAVVPHAGQLGLYTSGDGGKTWALSILDTSVTSGSIFFAQAGNDNPSEVYIYLSELGPLGLRVSLDNGQHFSQAGGQLPFGSLLGLLPLPGQPGHLLAYGDEGIAMTGDGGFHWKVISNIQGGIFEMTTPGVNQPIYAEGDSGVYVSQDGGQHFTLVYTQHSYSSLSVALGQPLVVYGKSGLQVYRSTDGGHSWSALPTIKGNLQDLVADPNNARQVYLALSYPTEIFHFQASSKTWQSLTPPA